jgi:hypothetical protein
MTWTHYVEDTLILLFVFTAIDYITDGWKSKRWLATFFLILLAVAACDLSELSSITSWLGMGIGLGILITILYAYVLRFARSSLPSVVATVVAFKAVRVMMFNPYPGAVFGSILAIVVVSCFTVYWSYQLLYGERGYELFGRR